MSSLHHALISTPSGRFGPRTRPVIRPVLPKADHQQLQHHLEQCEQMQGPDQTLLAHVLRHKVMTTQPVADLYARDLVTGGCRVAYAVNGGPEQTGLMSHRARTGSDSGVIPVASLLGATLIGMRKGQRAPLLREDGAIMSLSVLDVSPPN